MALELHCQRVDYGDRVDFLLVEYKENSRFLATRVEFTDIGDDLIQQPSFSLRPTQCQSLMDALWQCGFRPSEGTGSAGALAATQRHLDDMRKLVFGDGKPLNVSRS